MLSEEGQKIVGEAFIDLTIYRLITPPEVYFDLWQLYKDKHDGIDPLEKAKAFVKEFHNYESTNR